MGNDDKDWRREVGQTVDEQPEPKVLVKEVAEKFKTSDRRIRNYSDELEKQGYTFSKTTVGYRLYTPYDIEILGKALKSKDEYDLTVEMACSMVLNNETRTDSSGPSGLKPALDHRSLLVDVQNTIESLTENLPSREQVNQLMNLVENVVNQDKQKDEIIKAQEKMVEQLRLEREKDREDFLKSQDQFKEIMAAHKKTLDDNERFKEIIEETRQYMNKLDENPIEKHSEKKGFFSKILGLK
ncbi:hypothetical protein [Peribacillus sp. NPDC096448]|uniref:hypothetical protein n=1 Tax=Peribacillus sp. NPDC096448 TaxID=3364395 RepID=UPI0038183B34